MKKFINAPHVDMSGSKFLRLAEAVVGMTRTIVEVIKAIAGITRTEMEEIRTAVREVPATVQKIRVVVIVKQAVETPTFR